MTTSSEHAFRRFDQAPVKEAESQPKVAGVAWSPLKSGRLEYANRLYVGAEGFRPNQESRFGDRCMMIIDANHTEGKLVSQREKARLALIETMITGNTVSFIFRADQAADKLREKLEILNLDAFTFQAKFAADQAHPERGTLVHTTGDILGIDQGDEVALWLSRVVGQPVRLVMQKPESPRHRSEVVPGFDGAFTVLRFQDSFPVTALSHATLDIFNQRLAELHPDWPQFAPMNFRMNILLSGEINEHQLVGKFVKIGEVYFFVYRPKERCPMPAVDPDSGVMRGEAGFGSRYQVVLKDMHRELGVPENLPEGFRMKKVGKDEKERLEPKPLLGVDLIPLNEGFIGVEDPIEVVDELPPQLYEGKNA